VDKKEGRQKSTPKRLPFGALARAAAIVTVAVVLASCANQPQPAQPRMTGDDRDEHGCIGSAGYSWCAREGACVRPWEMAREKGFDLSKEAFERHCLEHSN
jgi:hypothetical protein